MSKLREGAYKAQWLQPQSHPKVIEHPTGVPNLQPSHKTPVPGPLQAPITLKPDGSEENKKMLKRVGEMEETLRTTKL